MEFLESKPFVYSYEEWMEKEGIPIYRHPNGVEDITALPRRPWARLGGKGTFIELEGTQRASKGLYVAEIPAGGALEPEKHVYEELLYILQGRGLAEVWHEGQDKVTFEWGEGSLFAIPLNAWHRLVNGRREPVLVYAMTSAPMMMNAVRSTEFVFNCDYKFTDRYTGQAEFFRAGQRHYTTTDGDPNPKALLRKFWETNFVPDVRTAAFPSPGADLERSQWGGDFVMSFWSGQHTSVLAAGTYGTAHFHPTGAVLMCLKSEGYDLLWRKEYGIHPFQDGHGDKVIKFHWKPGSIWSPREGEFHQHHNTGNEMAHLYADTGGGTFVLKHVQWRNISEGKEGKYLAHLSVREGGTRIEREDEDPETRRMFEGALRQKGLKSAMEPVVYRTEPLRGFLGWALFG